ncbi:hypothetical protein HanPI659440_Chr13g0510981 [Helianthus annuus]|nr:hypothetical protein HanPI659440_Chr13g0510981 [Helianthus annuus]
MGTRGVFEKNKVVLARVPYRNINPDTRTRTRTRTGTVPPPSLYVCSYREDLSN